MSIKNGITPVKVIGIQSASYAFKKLKNVHVRHKFEKEFAFFNMIASVKGYYTQKDRDDFFLKIANNPRLQDKVFKLLDEALRSQSATAIATILLIISEKIDDKFETVYPSNDESILLNAIDGIDETEIRFFWYLTNKIYSKNLQKNSDLDYFTKGYQTYQYTSLKESTELTVHGFTITVSSEGSTAMINDMITRRLLLPYTGGMIGVGKLGTFQFAIGRITKQAYDKITQAMAALDDEKSFGNSTNRRFLE
jgi:hypothetical protein